MSENLEFHYVVSYREGYGWTIASDTEDALFNDGTVYDWKNQEWIIPDDDVEVIDLDHYSVLQSMLRQVNGEK
jgi:hypothetical protein